MWHIKSILIAMAAMLFVVVPGVQADSLQLKNGNFLQGRYLGGTERAVQFEVNGKVRVYDIGEILSISFAAASADGVIPSSSAAISRNRVTQSKFQEKSKSNPAMRQDPRSPAPSCTAGKATPAERKRTSDLIVRNLHVRSQKFAVPSDSAQSIAC